ncbi:uncharacterized protein LOC132730459 isoform X2 [Ruditapes philippinarum]|uniref:uncharacterized protein LOC132730459 isoform X2 n=1 Tax=Ruditapes philippinarum TaxID=129788 RepID=UPI00295B6A4A|nr:uncharacterized protein LOC132730459 isoform X2 [Ruditapes philippinarum]
MKFFTVLALVFCCFYGEISGMPTYLGNCDTDADCTNSSVCMLPGFGKASAKAQNKCYFCECMLRNQCKMVDKNMTCNCTGSGYTGLYCETPRETNNLTATATAQILTSPGFPTFYCRDMILYWRIYAPADKRIRITVTYFATESFDVLAIFEGVRMNVTRFFPSDDNPIVAISRNADPYLECIGSIPWLSYSAATADLISEPFESSSNIVTIYFSSDDFIDQGPGWSLNYMYID